MRPGILVTADGAVFTGEAVGAEGVAVGEVIFNTSMTGYQEIVTDPSYAGQVVVLTAPQVGNYGATDSDVQADTVHARALVTRSMSRMSSSWRSQGDFADYLARQGLVALTEVDTRRLTRHITARGAMAVAVGSDSDVGDLTSLAADAPSMAGLALAADVSAYEPYRKPASDPSGLSVVAYDLGIKRDIVSQLNNRGIDVTVVPWDTPSSAVLDLKPDGVFLSNGPGDPEPLGPSVRAVRELLGSVPVFGICLGHQILGLALGAATYKLPFGHHGGNHPVRNITTGRVDITSQNHGFAVDLWALGASERPDFDGLAGAEQIAPMTETDFGMVEATHQNLNDGTNEGLRCVDIDAFSVQYHPEAAPGPNDALRLFDDFVDLIGGADAKAN